MALFTVKSCGAAALIHLLHLITVICNEVTIFEAISPHLTRPTGNMFAENDMTGTHHHHSSTYYCHVMALQYNYCV